MFKKTNKEKTGSGFSRRFRQNIWENRKFFTGLCVLDMLCLPGFAVVMHILCSLEKKDNESDFTYSMLHGGTFELLETALEILTVLLAALFLAGLPAALRSFSYLHKKNRTDMVFSLPVSTSSRFMADYFSGLFIYMIPFVMSVAVSVLFFAAGSLLTGNSLTEFSNVILRADGGADILLVKSVIMFTAVMIMFYTFSVFISVCCGSLSSTYLYSVLLNMVIPFLIIFSSQTVFGSCEFVDPEPESIALLGTTSPAGGLLFIEYMLESAHWYEVVFMLPLIIRMTAADLLLAVMAYMLYRKRKAEDTSGFVVFPFMFYAVLFIIVLFFFGVAYMTENNIYFVLILLFCAVIVCLMSVVYAYRKKNKISELVRSALYIALAYCVSAAFFTLGRRTGGFGADDRVPDVSSVKSVTFCDNTVLFENIVMDGITLYDEEAISAVCSIHSDIVKNIGAYDGIHSSARGATNGIRMVYALKNGDVLERIYYRDNDEKLMHQMYECDEYRQMMAEQMYRYIIDYPAYSNEDYLYITDHSGPDIVRYQCPDTPEIRNIVSEIAETLKDDIAECDEKWYEEEPYEQDHYPIRQGAVFILNNTYIPASFERTRSVIQEHKDVFEKYIQPDRVR